MSFLAALRLAVSSLFIHKGRSGLTSLGIVIGIAAVVALVGAAGGARQKLDERLESAGKNLIIIRPGARNWGGISDLSPLTSADADAIRRRVGHLLLGVAPWQVTPRIVTTGQTHWDTVLTGTTPDYVAVGGWRLVSGRSFNDVDMHSLAPVCVVGQTVRKKLFGERSNPVGQTIHVDRLNFRVIGVLGSKGRTPLGVDQDDQIVVPLPTLQRQLVGKEDLAMILVNPRSESAIVPAKEAIIAVLRAQHHIKPDGYNNFDVSSVEELSQFAVVLTKTLQLLVAVIASVSLVVGGIGIMNIMLVSLTERTREIGIRMAIGATPRDVLLQFLLEALALSLLGGFVGVVLGIAGIVGLAHLAGWPVVVSPAVLFLSFAVTAAVGIFFGYYPAVKASRLDPIQAIRHE